MTAPSTRDRGRGVAVVRTRPGAVSSAATLLAEARAGLAEAAAATTAHERYAAAHRAALRATAALLATRTRPVDRRRPQRNAWVLLAQVAPELAEWAAFFAAGAGKRAAAEAGLSRAVGVREADDLLRDAETYLALVETTLGLAHQPALPHLARPLRAS
jgi:hypothetical protein